MQFLAEWLLKRVLDSERAGEVLGDLVEGSKERGSFWFWRSVFAVLFFSTAKPTFRIVAAFALGSAGSKYGMSLFSWQRPYLERAATIGITPGSLLATDAMVGLLTIPWFLLPYSLLSGGRRHRLALISGLGCFVSIVLWPLLMSPSFAARYLFVAILCLGVAAGWHTWRRAVRTFSLAAMTFSTLFIVLNELQIHMVFAYARWRIGPVLAVRVADICLPLLILWLTGKLDPTTAKSEMLV